MIPCVERIRAVYAIIVRICYPRKIGRDNLQLGQPVRGGRVAGPGDERSGASDTLRSYDCYLACVGSARRFTFILVRPSRRRFAKDFPCRQMENLQTSWHCSPPLALERPQENALTATTSPDQKIDAMISARTAESGEQRPPPASVAPVQAHRPSTDTRWRERKTKSVLGYTLVVSAGEVSTVD
jgi:hypothetical protein